MTDDTERCPDCAATAPYWRPDDRECQICLALAEMPDEIDEIVEALDNPASSAATTVRCCGCGRFTGCWPSTSAHWRPR